MWVAGRILLITLMVIGVLLVAAGTATFVLADNWTDQIIDDISFDITIDSGAFMGAGDMGLVPGVILFAASIIMNPGQNDLLDVYIGFGD